MIIKKVKRFLKTDPEFSLRMPNDISEEKSLFDLGVLDSFGSVYLISFLEKEFNIKIDADDLEEENFCSLKNIKEFVINKINQR